MFVGIGALVVGWGFVHHGQPSWVIPVGMLVVASGALSAILRMHRVITDECYVSARTDGIETLLGGQLELTTWDNLAEARYDAARNIAVLARRDGTTLALDIALDGIAPEALARRLEHLRRKSGMGLL
jgi:hypothetical protein